MFVKEKYLNMGYRIRYVLKICSVVILILFYSCIGKQDLKVGTKVLGRQIHHNDTPYFIKGVCYHPVPKGETKRAFNQIDKDLSLMVEAGINTIRVYEPIDDIEVLNKISEHGLKLIVGFGYDQNGNFDLKTGSFLNYIKKFNTHPAILFGSLETNTTIIQSGLMTILIIGMMY